MDDYKQKTKKRIPDKDLFKKRWEHHEEKRKEKLKVLIEVRNIANRQHK